MTVPEKRAETKLKKKDGRMDGRKMWQRLKLRPLLLVVTTRSVPWG